IVGSVAKSGASSAAQTDFAATSNIASSTPRQTFMAPPQKNTEYSPKTVPHHESALMDNRKTANRKLFARRRPESSLGNLTRVLLRRILFHRRTNRVCFADQQER